MKTLSGIALLIILVVATNLQAAEPFCGELDADFFGPFDYTNTYDRRNLALVEGGHFTSNVRNLVSGNEGTVASELAYTLRAFPNHYPALIALTKLSLRRDKTVDVPRDQLYSAECFLDRAIRFRPSDVTVRTIYGNYLHSLGGRQDDAMEQYQVAAKLQPENPTVNYNLGLMYLKEKDYEQATVHAKIAYELDFPLPGLRNKLMKTGKWDGKLDEEVRDEVDENVGEKIGVEPQ